MLTRLKAGIIFSFLILSLNTGYASEAFSPNTSWMPAEKIILRGLDKVTARTFTSEASVNQLVKFGTLELIVRAAYKAPPEDPPESVCFIEIYDIEPDVGKKLVFSGWMFVSDPAISALAHPVYDVWIKDTVASEVLPEVDSRDDDNEIIRRVEEVGSPGDDNNVVQKVEEVEIPEQKDEIIQKVESAAEEKDLDIRDIVPDTHPHDLVGVGDSY